MYRIRKFRLDDLEKVMALTASAINEPYKPELFTNAFYGFPNGFLVVEDAGRNIIGTVVAIQTTGLALRVLILVVHSAWRGRGIGTQMVEMLKHVCFTHGLRKITLEVRIDNIRAMEFYRKLGFIRTGLIQNYYTDGSNGYVYEKMLY